MKNKLILLTLVGFAAFGIALTSCGNGAVGEIGGKDPLEGQWAEAATPTVPAYSVTRISSDSYIVSDIPQTTFWEIKIVYGGKVFIGTPPGTPSISVKNDKLFDGTNYLVKL